MSSEAPRARALAPGVLIPFLLVTLIWGSTWLVIRGQLAQVPASWSVTYRFLIAAVAMFIVAAVKKQPLRLPPKAYLYAAALGIAQFLLNFNFVYRAEEHVTSGLVAVVFALLVVPNSILGYFFLKQTLNARFLIGSAIAMAGVALLFVQEMRAAGDTGAREVLTGVGITLLAICSASVANVMQGARLARALPLLSTLAWAMLIGGLADALLALLTEGPPVFSTEPLYVAGLLYLGIAASAVAFPLYFGVIRVIGPGKAAYSGVLVPIIAMLLSTIFEDYRWSPIAIAGAVLSLIGLVIALAARQQRSAAQVEETPAIVRK